MSTVLFRRSRSVSLSISCGLVGRSGVMRAQYQFKRNFECSTMWSRCTIWCEWCWRLIGSAIVCISRATLVGRCVRCGCIMQFVMLFLYAPHAHPVGVALVVGVPFLSIVMWVVLCAGVSFCSSCFLLIFFLFSYDSNFRTFQHSDGLFSSRPCLFYFDKCKRTTRWVGESWAHWFTIIYLTFHATDCAIAEFVRFHDQWLCMCVYHIVLDNEIWFLVVFSSKKPLVNLFNMVAQRV